MTGDALPGAPLDAAGLEAIRQRASEAIEEMIGHQPSAGAIAMVVGVVVAETDALVTEVRRLRVALEEIEYLADCGMAVAATQAARAALAAPEVPRDR